MTCQFPIILSEPGTAQIVTRCKTSDDAVCDDCARLHRDDVKALIREALDQTDAATLITFTAPGSFGPVHSQRRCGDIIRRCTCGRYHADDDGTIGTPIEEDAFDYAGLITWNAASRKILSEAIRKIRYLTDTKIEFVAIPEAQARGALHWHVIMLDTVDVSTVELAVRGGINPATGYWIRAAHHGGHEFGRIVDVRPVTDTARAAAYLTKYLTKINSSTLPLTPAQAQHRSRIAEAVRDFRGPCNCRTTINFDLVDHETGEITAHQVVRHRFHSLLPATIQDRISPWHRSRCHRTRRALRQTGHGGRSLGRSRQAGPTLRELRQRRCQWREDESNADTGMINSDVSNLCYRGRGYGGATAEEIIFDVAGIEIRSKITHFLHYALPDQGGACGAPEPPGAAGLRASGPAPPRLEGLG